MALRGVMGVGQLEMTPHSARRPQKFSMTPRRQPNIKERKHLSVLGTFKGGSCSQSRTGNTVSRQFSVLLSCLVILESLIMIVGELSENDKQGISQSACVSGIALKDLRQFSNKFYFYF